MTTLPRCLHKRLIIRFLWLLCILGAFYTLAVFALWSRASIPPHNSRSLISAGPGTFKAHNSPNQPSNAALQPSSTPQLQRIQQADASEQSSATASQSPGRVFVHTFYYAWYGTLQVDGAWIHVSHKPQTTNHKPQTTNHKCDTANPSVILSAVEPPYSASLVRPLPHARFIIVGDRVTDLQQGRCNIQAVPKRHVQSKSWTNRS